jgi:hypothetical protein
MRKITNNCQDNNETALGIKGNSQCFATSDIMFLSFYSVNFKGDNDAMLKQYLESFDKSKAFEWDAHCDHLNKWLFSQQVKGVVKHEVIGKEKIVELLQSRPVIIGTKKMGGLPGGHIILGVDNHNDKINCNDPYGNANTNYKDKNGEAVDYTFDMFDSGRDVRCMWLEV